MKPHSSSGTSVGIADDTANRNKIGAIILLGAPGVGKGTQARELSQLWSIPHISTGELLRANVERGTPLGRSARVIMDRGDLVPDSVVNEMVEARLFEADTERGYILDGFPRTLDQAVWFTERVTALRKGLAVLAIGIALRRDQLLRRITGRRHCPVCQTSFNIYENPPKKDGVCDWDQGALVRRPDDNEETANRRLKLYDTLTVPIISYFQAQGQFIEISGDGPIDWITQRLLGARHLAEYEALVKKARMTPLKISNP